MGGGLICWRLQIEDSDIDQEDSHVFSQTRDQAVKHRRRPPPSARPPSTSQRNPQHSSSTDEQESPERVEQKEKLHAELKQVLSQKRSRQRASSCQLAQAEMDSEPAEEQARVEEASKAVEVMMETEAEVGASGYSVTGGGERGIFVKDVLKDSPAAKHLSLQQGDQLLSAKVFFDNVKYEDALRILQCAEPYKVSFQLKRTVPKDEVSVRPRVPSVEVKNPKVKIAKMSVKGTKPFKALKKRGGRFGLKRLKEKQREELVIEGTPPRLEMGDVDVDISLPKIKQRKSRTSEEEDVRGTASVAKAKKGIRFPRMKVKKYTRAKTEGKVETGQLEGHVNIPPSKMPEAKGKTKGKGHKFGMTFPKTKHIKSDPYLESGSVELKPPDVSLQTPSVEFSVSPSKDKDVEKRGLKFNPPNVEFALPLAKPEVSLPKVKGSAGIKAPKVDVKGEANAAEGKINVEGGMGDTKLRMPKLKLPKVRLSRHSEEIDGEIKVKTEGMKIPHVDVKTKGDGEIRLPETHLTKPKGKGEVGSFERPSVDASLPKVKFGTDGSLQGHERAVKTEVKMPTIDISVPEVDLEFDTGQRLPDEVEGTIKGAKISMPKVDISLPKMGSPDTDIKCPDGEGEFSVPSVDISVPMVKSDVDMDYYVGGDGKFKMPEFDITLPKLKPSEQEVEGGFKLPKVDIILPKYQSDHEGEGTFQLPSIEMEVDTKGVKFQKPVISLPKHKIKGDVEMDEGAEKGGEFKMPLVNITLPEIGTGGAEVDLQKHKIQGEKIKVSSVDISLPNPKGEVNFGGKIKGGVNIQGPKVKGGKFETPKIDLSLPKGKEHGNSGIDIHSGIDRNIDVPYCDIGVEGPEGKTGKFKMPKVNIILPKLPEGEAKIESPEDKGKIEMPTTDISLPKQKQEGDLNIDTKGATIQMPSSNINLPKIKSKEASTDVKGHKGEFKMLSLDISGPKIKSPEVDVKLQGSDVDISLPTPKGDVDISFEGPDGKDRTLKIPTVDVLLPKVNVPEGEVTIKGPELKGRKIELPDIDISLPKGKLDGEADGHGSKGGKFHMPSVDFSLPKIKTKRREVNIKGPEIKDGSINMPEVDVSPPEGKAEVEINVEGPGVKGGKFKMPKFDYSLLKGDVSPSKIKAPEVDVNLKGPEIGGPQVDLPSVDISLPKGKVEGNFDVEGPEVRGGKIKMPKIDMSLQKDNLPEGDLKIKDQDIKTGKITIPDIDMSLLKGNIGGEIEAEGHVANRGKFHMPSIDVTLPKMKSKPHDIDVEVPQVQGAQVDLPSVDISLPKGKVRGDLDVEGPKVKGGKFKMAKNDESLPKVNLPEGDLSIKGPGIKAGKITMPDIDLSLPKGKVKSRIEAEGHGAKGGTLHMPSIDITLPKMKTKGPDINVQGPEIEGFDINMPSLDVSLPKIKSPELDINFEGPDLKGETVKIPRVDVSLPKGTIEGGINVEGPDVKGGKFKMPKFDVSLPHVSVPKLEGPDIKGKIEI
ncbi:neuroblast differentiation-associated protein AHNAK [Nematolebias whitei]|uniref:neuroblast differentiation-associated protein AHNAK n=1 Tax=Nematolebias whitei TaxID=451745 RepID=UPI00189B3CB3|nr:neuroblast differentiation-associated protein AHNAK [Nematolebias whitei]